MVSSPFAHVLQCVGYVSGIFCLWTQLFSDGCTSSLASAATQLLVVTTSFVVAANIATLKPFNTAMRQRQPGQKKGPSGKALWKLTENHAIQWCFPLFSNSTVEKLYFSRRPKGSHREHSHRFDFHLFGLVGASPCWLGLSMAVAVVDSFFYRNAKWLRMHINKYILHNVA